MLTEKSVRDLLAAFASSDPTPGGGSAAALASAVGASLLTMVAALPKTRSGSSEDRAALTGAASALADVQRRLTEAIDLDSGAYDNVVAAYRLPKKSGAEQAARTAAIHAAFRGATDVPLGVMRLSALALKEARVVAMHGHRAAASDVGVAITLLTAGLKSARLNVDINLGSVGDPAYAQEVKAAADGFAGEGAQAAEAASASLQN
jgi:formiminotetrahydrofolate cyclodeaminase